jgi:hypothetical protein
MPEASRGINSTQLHSRHADADRATSLAVPRASPLTRRQASPYLGSAWSHMLVARRLRHLRPRAS